MSRFVVKALQPSAARNIDERGIDILLTNQLLIVGLGYGRVCRPGIDQPKQQPERKRNAADPDHLLECSGRKIEQMTFRAITKIVIRIIGRACRMPLLLEIASTIEWLNSIKNQNREN
jgi:hypothetical protein